MCGIVGYIGSSQATPVLLESLRRLEYRGYDSVGIATAPRPGVLRVVKTAGRVDRLTELLRHDHPISQVGIAHSRWATHGMPNSENAHPHLGGDDSLAIVHNGVIENHHELREQLRSQGYHFRSDTDSEVIAHLVHHYLRAQMDSSSDIIWNALVALRNAARDLRGSFAVVVLLREQPGVLLAARRGSPLVIGCSGDGNAVASDLFALRGRITESKRMEDGEFAIIRAESVRILTADLVESVRCAEALPNTIEESDGLGDFQHYTQKEIYEQASSLRRVMEQSIGKEDDKLIQMMDSCEKICITSCGTSWHAGLYGKYLIEELAGIPVDLEYASEYRYRTKAQTRNSLLLALSQSGETADTLGALRDFRETRQPTLAMCNVAGSTLAEEADAVLFLRAGQESGVAATKTYTSQLALLAKFAMSLASGRAKLNGHATSLSNAMAKLPDQVTQALQLDDQIRELAEKLYQAECFLFIGRRFEYATALEGALKLKEMSYLHAEGYAAGELKHGPLALVDEATPTVALATDGRAYSKTLSNMEEIAARGGPIVAVTNVQDPQVQEVADEIIHVPVTEECLQPILNIIPLQLLAYHVAVLRECDVDRPRNLAKSVTVE